MVLAVTLWVIGFASSILLIMGLTILKLYRRFSSNKKIKEREVVEYTIRQKYAIEKWKRNVLRP